jgi:hypothetical protein
MNVRFEGYNGHDANGPLCRLMTQGGRILRHRDQGTLIRPCRALRALRLNSNVDSVLSREWRFNDYKSNYKTIAALGVPFSAWRISPRWKRSLVSLAQMNLVLRCFRAIRHVRCQLISFSLSELRLTLGYLTT